MKPETADESSRHHPWWKSIYFIYDIVMHILLLAFNVAAFLYVRHEKIPISGDTTDKLKALGNFYFAAGIVGIISWVIILIYFPEMHFRGGTIDRISHILDPSLFALTPSSILVLTRLCFLRLSIVRTASRFNIFILFCTNMNQTRESSFSQFFQLFGASEIKECATRFMVTLGREGLFHVTSV
ncbi:unnamed protein product [Microthlaspi erraticum]|uniref:Uncharacterized protein n=1 Tax=Microthlaspi erraticum TaxID=1685480 RepID=A0A6D2JBP0_9BRAS|nr:unnamed protein product [Microthlaspi erraticum]